MTSCLSIFSRPREAFADTAGFYYVYSQQPSNGSEFPPGAMEAFEGRRQSGVLGPADDDVEDQMLGRDTYIASGLAPRRELRVVNGDE